MIEWKSPMHNDLQLIEWIEAELATDARHKQDERDETPRSSALRPEDAGWRSRRDELLDAFDQIASLHG